MCVVLLVVALVALARPAWAAHTTVLQNRADVAQNDQPAQCAEGAVNQVGKQI